MWTVEDSDNRLSLFSCAILGILGQSAYSNAPLAVSQKYVLVFTQSVLPLASSPACGLLLISNRCNNDNERLDVDDFPILFATCIKARFPIIFCTSEKIHFLRYFSGCGRREPVQRELQHVLCLLISCTSYVSVFSSPKCSFH